MDSKKYNRSVNLICPTCGSDKFEYDGNGDTVSSLSCASCKRTFTRSELIGENSENISIHKNEIVKEVTKDFAKEMRKTLKESFRGSKYIRFK